MMEMSTIKNIVTAAVVIGGVYLVYANRKRLQNLFGTRKNNTVNGRVGSNDIVDPMSGVYKNFILYADIFQGLYEPMFKASVGSISQERIKNVFAEWNIRMKGINNISIELRGWWSTIIDDKITLTSNELQKRAEQVVNMIENCCILRDERSELVADNNTNLYYQHVDGIMFEQGQKLRVESPCWYMPTNPVRIIEKGYCEFL